jgi:hypothetical protein
LKKKALRKRCRAEARRYGVKDAAWQALSVKRKRPKVEPDRQPTLFEMEKLEAAGEAGAEGDKKIKEERAEPGE